MEKKKKKLGLKWALVIILVIIALFLALIGFITDYLWFKELGYVSVFFKKLFTMLQVGVPSFIVITILSYLYLKILKRGYFKKVESTEQTNEKTLNGISWAFSAIFGALVAFTLASQLWFGILQFTNSTNFDIADPLFNLDISFYVFKLEFLSQLNQFAIGVIIGFIILTVLYYMVLLSMRKPQMFEEVEPELEPESEERYNGNDGAGNMGGQSPFGAFGKQFGDAFGQFGQAFGGRPAANGPYRKKKQFDDDNFMQLIGIASKQLIVLGVIFFIMIAVNFWLRQYDLLYSHTGVLYGAGFTDVNITLWVYRILIALSLVGAITFIMGISKRKFKMVFAVPVIMIVVGLLGSGASALVQNLVVSPDELNKETQYLERNIAFTQKAYDLDNVTSKDFAADNLLTKQDIINNDETITNIRINDYEPVEKFYNQTQSIRPYYAFNDVDVDRYIINGDYTQTFLSAREIDETKIAGEWLNRHLMYTHGYGITLSRVDQITASGQPDMMIDSIPPVSDVEEIQLTRPEIYFGELTSNYVLANTSVEEFDYPQGDSNIYTTYEGTAGIKLNMLNRTMFAIRERSLKILVSTNINSESKIIINRNIMNRVNQIMPYLSYDSDPYMVTVDGQLFWMLDAYTTSSKYPYSEPYADTTNINYIRNSVKVVINAYNGSTNYYLVDDQDPIANTYMKIYPDLFKPFEEMPESLQAHIRYPNVMFNIQANVYTRYHMENVRVFYQNEDRWNIANEIYGTAEAQMVPNYYIMKLPGEEKAEFVNSIPYTPYGKQNMTGLLMARNDGENYGELVLYRLPKSKIIYGPMQIEAQIDQSTEISKEFSLWNSSGSSYTRGNMFIIPIEGSLLYVEPVYLEATNSSIPEVKRVIVCYNDRIAYKATLGEALDELFGSDSGTQGSNGGTVNIDGEEISMTNDQLAQKAAEALQNAQSAQQRGDWAGYGSYINQVERYLNLLVPQNETEE